MVTTIVKVAGEARHEVRVRLKLDWGQVLGLLYSQHPAAADTKLKQLTYVLDLVNVATMEICLHL